MYACDVCGLKYKWKQSLNRHLKETHRLDKSYNNLNSVEKIDSLPSFPPGILNPTSHGWH